MFLSHPLRSKSILSQVVHYIQLVAAEFRTRTYYVEWKSGINFLCAWLPSYLVRSSTARLIPLTTNSNGLKICQNIMTSIQMIYIKASWVLGEYMWTTFVFFIGLHKATFNKKRFNSHTEGSYFTLR